MNILKVELYKLIFISLIFYISGNCKKENVLKVDDKEKVSGSTISIKNFERVSVDSKGVVQWKLNAGETYYFLSDDKTILYDIKMEQYEKGKIKANIKADRGEIKKKENKIYAWGNIYIKTTDGKILEGEEIQMDTDANTLYSDKKVQIKTAGTTIRGVGLIADNNLNKFKILKPEGVSVGSSTPLK